MEKLRDLSTSSTRPGSDEALRWNGCGKAEGTGDFLLDGSPDIVFLHFAIQGASGDIQLPGCLVELPICFFQDPTDQGFFDLWKRSVS